MHHSKEHSRTHCSPLFVCCILHDSLLRLGPDLDEVLEHLDGLRDVGRALLGGDRVGGRGGGGVGGEVEHEDGGEADGEVLRVHLVARVLRRHPRQVVHHVHQAVLHKREQLQCLTGKGG